MKKRMLAAIMAFCLGLSGCGSAGISQKEYDSVIANNEELSKRLEEKNLLLKEIEESKNETFERAKEYFSDIEGASFQESKGGKYKTFLILVYADLKSDGSGIGAKFGEKASNAIKVD